MEGGKLNAYHSFIFLYFYALGQIMHGNIQVNTYRKEVKLWGVLLIHFIQMPLRI